MRRNIARPIFWISYGIMWMWTLILLILNSLDIINIGWLWILAPLWIPFVISLFLALILIMITIILKYYN